MMITEWLTIVLAVFIVILVVANKILGNER